MLNLGIDIVSIDRIQSILNSDKELRFLNKIFSEKEIAESENKGDKSQYFSGKICSQRSS
jgi:holo-[acyl-carrier protein] synthase